MSFCVAGNTCSPGLASRSPDRDEVLHLSRKLSGGHVQTALAVPGLHCGNCIRTVEAALGRLPFVRTARVNLSSKRVVLDWDANAADPARVVETLERAGFQAYPIPVDRIETDGTLKGLVLALGVAGFAAGNIMLLSVSVWSGAEGSTRDLFHWISALIAIPAVAYSGRIFFRPAWAALRTARLNMDVPISLAVLLAVGMSLYETWTHGPDAYFDASVGLLFFLLIGRTLDHMMRDRARSAVQGLGRMSSEGATVIDENGARRWISVDDLEPGMRLALVAGDRVPVDARVLAGESDIDGALATGESVPTRAAPGTDLPAGVLNLTGALTVEALRTAKDSFLAEMIRMLDAAEGGEARYRRLADRAAAIYAPVVHLAALATFLGWLWATGDWHRAILVAISVLIITCPCALGLAVPIVQVVAASRLFRRGIMIRDGAAMERLATIDHVIFDKTGTLTAGVPELRGADRHDQRTLATAAALARHSRHPYSTALVAAAETAGIVPDAEFDTVTEIPGNGIEAIQGGSLYRLGRAAWVTGAAQATTAGVVLARDGTTIDRFKFTDRPRPHARDAVDALVHSGLDVEVLSGDAAIAVAETAETIGLPAWRAGQAPADKIARIEQLRDEGHRVLMVGDGLNDAPSLAMADVSMVPATAADVGRQKAGLVFLRPGLEAVPLAIETARRARTLIQQNFGLAILYNAVAIPLAVAGFASPLVAALAMSISSVLVTLNALRLADLRPETAVE